MFFQEGGYGMKCSNKIAQKSKEETTIRGKFKSYALITLIVFDISSDIFRLCYSNTLMRL